MSNSNQIECNTDRLHYNNNTLIIIIHEFHRDASLEQNFRAAVCHVLR